MAQASTSFSRKFNETAPPEAGKVIGQSGLRGTFEDLWKQGKIDTSDLWNQGRFWKNRDPLLGKAQKPGLNAEADDDGNGDGTPGASTGMEPPDTFTDKPNPLAAAVNAMNPAPRARLEKGLDDMLDEPMNGGPFNFDKLVANPQRYEQEYLSKLVPENRTLFEQRMKEFTGANTPADRTDDLELATPNDHALAFMAVAIGSGAAGRMHEYLREREESATAEYEEQENKRAQSELAFNAMMEELNSIDIRLFNIRELRHHYQHWLHNYERMDELQGKIKDLEDDLTEDKSKLTDAESKLDQLKAQRDQLVSQGQGFAADQTATQQELDRIRQAREAADARIEHIRQDFHDRMGLELRGTDIYERGEDGVFRRVAPQRDAYLREKYAEVLQLNERSQDLRGHEEELVRKIEDTQRKMTDNATARHNLETRIGEQEGIVKALRDKISETETQLAAARTEYNQLNDEVRNDPQLQAFAREHGLDLNNRQDMETALKKGIGDLNEEERSLLQRRAELSQKVESLTNQRTDAINGIDASLATQQSLVSQQIDLTKQGNELASQNQQLLTELRSIESQKAELRQQWKELKPEIQQVNQEILEKKGQVEAVADAKDKVEDANEAAKALDRASADASCSTAPVTAVDLSKSVKTASGEYIVSFRNEQTGEIKYGTLSADHKFTRLTDEQEAAMRRQMANDPSLQVYDQYKVIEATSGNSPMTALIVHQEAKQIVADTEAQQTQLDRQLLDVQTDLARLQSSRTAKMEAQSRIEHRLERLQAREDVVVGKLRASDPAYADMSIEDIIARENELGHTDGLASAYTKMNDRIGTLNTRLTTVNTALDTVNGQIDEIQTKIDQLSTQRKKLLVDLGDAKETASTATENLSSAQERRLTNWRGETVYEDKRFFGLGLSYKDAQTGEIKQHGLLASVAGQAAHAWQDFWKGGAQTGNQIDDLAEKSQAANQTLQQTREQVQQNQEQLQAAAERQAQLEHQAQLAHHQQSPGVSTDPQTNNTSRYSAVATPSELSGGPAGGTLSHLFSKAVGGISSFFHHDAPDVTPDTDPVTPDQRQQQQLAMGGP